MHPSTILFLWEQLRVKLEVVSPLNHKGAHVTWQKAGVFNGKFIVVIDPFSC